MGTQDMRPWASDKKSFTKGNRKNLQRDENEMSCFVSRVGFEKKWLLSTDVVRQFAQNQPLDSQWMKGNRNGTNSISILALSRPTANANTHFRVFYFECDIKVAVNRMAERGI